MNFRVQRVRFELEALRPLTFPAPASNKLRGAIGAAMRERGDGAYEEFFAPVSMHGPSGLADPPRPFVLRSEELNGRRLGAGEHFEFVVHLFAGQWLESLREAAGRVAGTVLLASPAEDVVLPLTPTDDPVRRLRVEFVTPVELKSVGKTLGRPEFGALMTRVRNRISTLRQRYGEGPLELDFAAFGERASRVTMTECRFEKVVAQRKSAATGQVHPLSGYVGHAVYEGDLTEFVPLLRIAEWTGVGRQTTWGKGVIRVARA